MHKATDVLRVIIRLSSPWLGSLLLLLRLLGFLARMAREPVVIIKIFIIFLFYSRLQTAPAQTLCNQSTSNLAGIIPGWIQFRCKKIVLLCQPRWCPDAFSWEKSSWEPVKRLIWNLAYVINNQTKLPSLRNRSCCDKFYFQNGCQQIGRNAPQTSNCFCLKTF